MSYPNRPFIIHTNQSTVHVLGTAFNVKSISGGDNVQVAVVEGRVSINGDSNKLEKHSVVLKKGQYGYLDVKEQSITVDDYAVANYLTWKSGRLKFEDLSLGQVCLQLNRLYDIRCEYTDEELKDRRLMANFSNDSLEKTLSVISLSLQIDYIERVYRLRLEPVKHYT